MFKRMPGESFDDALRRAFSEGYEIKRVPHGLSREFFESMRAPMTVSIIRKEIDPEEEGEPEDKKGDDEKAEEPK